MSHEIDLAELGRSLGPGPVLAHCDAGRTARLVQSGRSRAEKLALHTRNLREIGDRRTLFVPAFNYDFCKTGRFDLDADPSQVGPITEHIRTDVASWRSDCPVFSVSGTGTVPAWARTERSTVDPFDESSVFAQVVAEGGSIVWYGAPIHATTFVHHVERLAGGPPYRYDKHFPGEVTLPDGSVSSVTLQYHVRPLGYRLEYDWSRLESDLRANGVCRPNPDFPTIVVADAAEFLRFVRERFDEDPLYLLDLESRSWVEPMLDQLGRRFQLTDFEGRGRLTG